MVNGPIFTRIYNVVFVTQFRFKKWNNRQDKLSFFLKDNPQDVDTEYV